MHMIHRESLVTPPALSITFSKCQLPRQGLLENFQQNVVLQLTFQCLLFYLSDFTTHWKKNKQPLHTLVLTTKHQKPLQHLESIPVSELLCEYSFQQAVGLRLSSRLCPYWNFHSLFLFPFSFILAMIVLLTTWLVFKYAVYGHWRHEVTLSIPVMLINANCQNSCWNSS